MPEVVVTGYGVRTAFGAGAAAVRRGVFAGTPAFAPTTRFDTRPFRTAAAATDGAPGPRPLREVLGECAEEAVAMAGLPRGGDTAVLVGTGGDFTGLTRFWRGAGAEPAPGPDAEPAAPVAESVPARQADLLAERIGAQGRRLAFTNACVASATALIHGCRLIEAGLADAVLCAGGYLVEEENFAKFDSGMAFSRDGAVRPFSADRSGLLLGDGAAAIVLESAAAARRRGSKPLAAVAGWGAAGDAHHLARPHPEASGLVSAARQALRRAGDPDGEQVDYVNAHGTATKPNDIAETRGLHTVFAARADQVPVSSTKGATGHLLEAAGAVEFVITLLALRDGVLPPTAGFTTAGPGCDLDYVPNRPRPADLRRALTVNAAFGGANTALLLERR
ncbi:MAG TPA: beta-ketoacyl-[acyl-carrier-protein] synthase family protein [Actinocrinis sp.]|nr:beta-ketoacyl-[acyl-carrier-protein] synthase family protein [Actinocrinis sp.]